MTNYSPRGYVDDDLADLQAAMANWRLAAGLPGYCHIGDLAHRIYEGLVGRSRGDLVRIWADGDGVAAVALCGRYDTSFDLFARPDLRGTATELDMLAHAYRVTREAMVHAGKAGTWAISDVYGDDLIRARQLERLGFERYRMWDHITSRPLDDLPSAPLPPGYSVRSATIADADQLAEVRNQSFGSSWTGPQLRDEVLLRPGYRPELEFVVVAPDSRFAAFTVTWLDEVNGVGHFEPVGTSASFRRLGLARGLMCHGLAQLRRLGMGNATVEHDATNAAARALYAGLGFGKQHTTYGHRRVE